MIHHRSMIEACIGGTFISLSFRRCPGFYPAFIDVSRCFWSLHFVTFVNFSFTFGYATIGCFFERLVLPMAKLRDNQGLVDLWAVFLKRSPLNSD
jgi:hypothetical protein